MLHVGEESVVKTVDTVFEYIQVAGKSFDSGVEFVHGLVSYHCA